MTNCGLNVTFTKRILYEFDGEANRRVAIFTHFVFEWIKEEFSEPNQEDKVIHKFEEDTKTRTKSTLLSIILSRLGPTDLSSLHVNSLIRKHSCVLKYI